MRGLLGGVYHTKTSNLAYAIKYAGDGVGDDSLRIQIVFFVVQKPTCVISWFVFNRFIRLCVLFLDCLIGEYFVYKNNEFHRF